MAVTQGEIVRVPAIIHQEVHVPMTQKEVVHVPTIIQQKVPVPMVQEEIGHGLGSIP